MAERRKIVIQTGADEPLPAPHFDAEATLTARPVVPLTDQEAQQIHYANYAGRAAAKPFWKRPALLALIVLFAVGIGVAAGLAIGIYRNRNTAEAPMATAPASTVEDTKAGQTVEQPQPTPTAEQARAAVPEESDERDEAEETPAESKTEERERTARHERNDGDDDEGRSPVAAKPPVVREKKPVKIDEYVIEDGREARRAEKEQMREERRAERRGRRRRGREDEINIPRGINRAGREVDRIREIFEGRQP
jgi:hypothetical protein